MNWYAVLQYVIGGVIVSWPAVIAGFVVNWKMTKRHVDKRTTEQNDLIAQITADQTSELLASRHPDRVSDPAGKYQQHGQQDPGTAT